MTPELMTEMEAIERIVARGDLKVLGLPVDDLNSIYTLVQQWNLNGGRPSMIEDLRERVLLEERLRFYEEDRSNVHSTAVIGEPAQWRAHETTRYPVEIHPTATVGALSAVDAGCERPTIIGAHTQVMKQVHIGHGVQIGERCDIATGTVIAGEVTIGNDVRIGIGALLKPYITVGNGARIGMGAVVLADIPPYECWAGSPARKLYDIDPTTGELKVIIYEVGDSMQALRHANGICAGEHGGCGCP